MKTENACSWGRVPHTPQTFVRVSGSAVDLPALLAGIDARIGRTVPVLPYGNGRSYGDSNLNPGGALLDARPLATHIHFDSSTGTLTCEAGVLLSEILSTYVPMGWFLPVTPGTEFVTVGGAIANDVHGKNHHRVGCFGHHVNRFELLRSDGSRHICSPTQNVDWFSATIGGLGLTGFITWAELQLRPITSPFLDAETIRFRSLSEFFELSAESESTHEYTVSWIDCAFAGPRLGRGLLSRGNHASTIEVESPSLQRQRTRWEAPRMWSMPFVPPFSLVNSASLKVFNTIYFHRPQSDRMRTIQHYRPFFYPLDTVLHWNRIYGPRGFYQYQCVVPTDRAQRSIELLLQAIAASGMGSFLAVLKTFGSSVGRGLLSFPMPGTTLALDFPNRGPRLHDLFTALDRILLDAGGRLYPAKDGRMGSAVFKAGFPRWREFEQFVDPRFSSGLWRRVTGSADHLA